MALDVRLSWGMRACICESAWQQHARQLLSSSNGLQSDVGKPGVSDVPLLVERGAPMVGEGSRGGG